MRALIRYGYVPLVGALAGLGVWLAGHGAPRWSPAIVVIVAIAASFTAERLLPVDPGWNRDQ